MNTMPVIGITSYRERARWRMWNEIADLLDASYARAVEAVGGVPVLLPPQTDAAAGPVLARLDGLVVSGGPDVDPELYGAEPHPATGSPRPERDRWELALLAASRDVGLPVLGVCRGMQLLAISAGGSLEQHVPDRVGHERHAPAVDAYGEVDIAVTSGSLLQRLVGDRVAVSCHHHQAVASHPGLVATARADDQTVEALEDPAARFRLGVQWHPEMREDQGLLAGLAAAAAGRL